MNGIDFIVSVIDHASSPFKAVEAGINNTASKFSQLDKQASQATKNIGKNLSDTGGILKGFGPLLAGAFSIAAITSFGQSVVETTAKYQKFEAVLTTQLGSAKAGSEAMKMIQDFAATTPFQVDEITGSFVKLASQGFTPTKDQLINLGDLAASMGKPFDQLAEAVLDAQTGEFERLRGFGIKASKSGNDIALTFKGQTTVIDKSSAAMQNYLLQLGKGEGVMGSMAAISNTTGGKLSNLSDSVDNLKKGIGEGLKPVIDTIIDKLKGFTDRLNKMGEWMKAHPKEVRFFATAIGIAAAAIAVMTVAVWAFNTALWANPITWVVAGIIGLAAVIAYAITYFDGWGQSVNSLWNIIKSFTTITVVMFKSMWEGITYPMEMAWLKIKDFFQWIGEKVTNVGEAISKLVNFDFSGALESVNKKITTTASQEIDATKKAHEDKMKGFADVTRSELKNIGSEWDKVGITKSKDADSKESPIERAIKKATGGGGAGAAGAGDKGKDMANKVNVGGSKPTTINLTIHKLQDQIVVHTTNLQTGAKEAGRQIVEEILMAINSVNGKASAAA